MFRFSVVKPSYDIQALIELVTRVACGELSCSLPDNVFCIAADPDGDLESRSNVTGWHDDRGIFVVTADRQPHEIARTLYHECSHHCDSLKYGGDLSAALADKEQAELRARQFAAEQTRDLPPYKLLDALNERLHRQRYPRAHIESLVVARRELQRLELDDFEPYGDPN